MSDNPSVNPGKTVRPGRKAAHAVSDDAKTNAGPRKSGAEMNTQKGKKVTKVTTRTVQKNAGMGSHKILYDATTGGHKSEPDDDMADAHNPHKHAGIESYLLSHDAKTGARKAVVKHGKTDAPKTLKKSGVQVQKGADEKKTGVHKGMKRGFVADIEEETKKNRDFRRVLYTGTHCQIVVMRLKPMEDIGMETHDDVDQFFRFEEGQGSVVINGRKHAVKNGGGVIVPCGSEHNVTNTSKTADLKLYTIYSPPNHRDKVVRKTKQDALAKEEHFNGKTTE
jgi:mannose-6-phosphate isomerase-like protein (cupin superfamily)